MLHLCDVDCIVDTTRVRIRDDDNNYIGTYRENVRREKKKSKTGERSKGERGKNDKSIRSIDGINDNNIIDNENNIIRDRFGVAAVI